MRLRAVCDPALEPGTDLPPGVAVVPTLGAALAECQLDAVVVATPIETHSAVALQALRAGCHVLVEKPIATELAALDELLEEANRQGSLVSVNHLLLHHAAFLRLLQEVACGRIGEVRSIVSVRISAGVGRVECPWWTLAPHDLSLIDAVAPQVLGGTVFTHRRGPELLATLAGGGVEARLALSLCGAKKVRLFVVQGSKGALVFDDLHPGQLTLHEAVGELLGDRCLEERHLRSRLGFGQVLPCPGRPPLNTALQRFVASCRAGALSQNTLEHMRRVVRSLEAGPSFELPLPSAAGVTG